MKKLPIYAVLPLAAGIVAYSADQNDRGRLQMAQDIGKAVVALTTSTAAAVFVHWAGLSQFVSVAAAQGADTDDMVTKACSGKTQLDHVSCEHWKKVLEWKDEKGSDYHHFGLALWQFGLARKTLATEFDHGKITREQYDAADFMVAYNFAGVHIAIEASLKEARERKLQERQIQAQERAAAAADRANQIEAHKICLRLTGRLCPSASNK